MIPNNELFVDTGIHTGYAFFTGTIKPITGCIDYPIKIRKTKENYIRFAGVEFINVLDSFNPAHVTLEEPEAWGDSEKSEIAIKSGSLFHLYCCVVTYANMCAIKGIPFSLIKPREWKGQLTKQATEYRIKLINNIVYKSDHISDAVGMGLSRDKELWTLKRKVKKYEK